MLQRSKHRIFKNLDILGLRNYYFWNVNFGIMTSPRISEHLSILRCGGKASTFVCSVLGNPSIGVDGQSTWALGTQDMEIFGKFF